MSRNAYTTCDEPGCDRSPANGHVLYRANPKGERGIFMCREHEQATWQQPSIVRVLDGWSDNQRKPPHPTHHTTNTPNAAHNRNQGPTTRLTLFVPGKSAPQGSKRHVGNGRMIESSREVGPWRERVALAAQQAMHEFPWGMFCGAVTIRLDFILPRPKTTPKRSTPPAVKRPDIDKLARACLDALTNTVISDDSLVVDLHPRKRLAEIGETPGVRIEVSSDVEEWR